MSQEELKKQRKAEYEAEEFKSRHRSLGNIRFIGELFKFKVSGLAVEEIYFLLIVSNVLGLISRLTLMCAGIISCALCREVYNTVLIWESPLPEVSLYVCRNTYILLCLHS